MAPIVKVLLLIVFELVPGHLNQKLPLSMPPYCYPTPRILPLAKSVPIFSPSLLGKGTPSLEPGRQLPPKWTGVPQVQGDLSWRFGCHFVN